MKKPDVSIIIVSYNTRDILVNCIESVIKTAKGISYELIVVDNDSKDESGESIRKLQNSVPNLFLIENKENLGFSKGNNIGVKKASGRYILFLNSDTVVYPDTILSLVKFMDVHRNAGAATCRVQLPNGKLDDAAHRGFPTPWNAFCHFSELSRIFPHSKLFSGYSLGWMDMSKTHEIDGLAGAFMIVRREAGEQVSWWDEDYFWYGEDLDFCYKLKEKGWKIYYIPTVSILHYKGVSGGIKDSSKHLSTATAETRKRAQKARFEAMRIFYKKHYSSKYSPLVQWLVFRAISLKYFLSSF